jgi:hypothetical protein
MISKDKAITQSWQEQHLVTQMCLALLLVLDWEKILPSCYCKSQQEQLTSSSINCSKDVTRQI